MVKTIHDNFLDVKVIEKNPIAEMCCQIFFFDSAFDFYGLETVGK